MITPVRIAVRDQAYDDWLCKETGRYGGLTLKAMRRGDSLLAWHFARLAGHFARLLLCDNDESD